MKLLYVVLVASLLAACGQPTEEPAQAEELDVCEQAALHREACMGDYVTPPLCDEPGAQAAAQEILDTPCDQFSAEFESTGKADGAFCDWFGKGCTPDEPLFIGPACATNSDCDSGFCVEEHCFDGVTSAEFDETLDLFTESRKIIGSDTALLVSNSETRTLRREMIAGAQHSIHFSAFGIKADDMGYEMVADFVAAAQRGVEVRVIIDATTQYLADYEMLTTMAEAGVEVLAFNPVTEWAGLRLSLSLTANDRLHEKILVVDGREVVMGGRNVGDMYYNDGRWRDVDVYVQGSGVAGIQELYLSDWDRLAALERASGCESQADWGFSCPTEPLAEVADYYPELDELGTATTRAIYSDPMVQDTPYGYLTTVALVRAARSSITIANAYFVPPRRLRRHLKAAAERGVKVRVVMNSLTSTDSAAMYYAQLNYYKELIGAGIELYEYNGNETMHAKTMLIDDELAVVGSFNLDPRSAIDNSESMLLISDGAAVRQLKDAYEDDIRNSTRASADIPLSALLKAKSLRLVEPLL